MSRKKKQTKSMEELLQEALVPKEEQPYDVPENWVWVRLLNGVVSCLDKFRKPVNARERELRKGDIPYYGATGQVGWIDDYLTNEELVLVGEDGAPFLDPIKPKAYRIEGKAWVNNHAHILKSSFGSVGNRFLTYYLNQFNYNGFVTGTTRLKLTQAKLKQIPFPLPPLPEQKRIVNRVESLLGKIDEAKQLIKEAQESFEQRRAAILARAFCGELTRTWREQNPDIEPADRLLERIREEKAQSETLKRGRKKSGDLSPIDPPYELPEGWTWVRLGEIAESTVYGTSTKTNDEANGIPVIRMGNIQYGEIDLTNLRYLPSDHPDIEKYQLEENDLLFNRTNSYELVGKTGIVRSQHAGKMTFASYLVRVRLYCKDLLAQYICYYINSVDGRNHLLSTVTQQVGQANINATKLLGLPVPLPPENELIHLNRLLQQVFKIEEESKSALTSFDFTILTQSILARAFRGELGTNDSSEENALELLKQTLAEQHGLAYEQTPKHTLLAAEQGELYKIT
ncbi:restriction endonuclease subunit S [Desmospora activa]|uniref:Type I restriction enzyme S subunit n=1 Tax=Desmospora activa DSM 45169 TaxID=1121389 RepID=A0A2T4Z6M5_9BACL|nr:restriction endonuclease subunit S [Desmospora activa]PTM57546.1 type I restriction enzyme S subunit [Desmospora activa DSM 45169]